MRFLRQQMYRMLESLNDGSNTKIKNKLSKYLDFIKQLLHKKQKQIKNKHKKL